MKALRLLLICGIFFAVVGAGQDAPKTYIGEISDSQCAHKVHSNSGDHAEMLKSGMAGNTPAECTQECVKSMGGQYVLVGAESKDHQQNVYSIQEQDKVANFAGKKVKLIGTFDPQTKKLRVRSVESMP